MRVLRGRYGLVQSCALGKKKACLSQFGRFFGFGLVFTKMSTIFVGKRDRFALEIVIADKIWSYGWLTRRMKAYQKRTRLQMAMRVSNKATIRRYFGFKIKKGFWFKDVEYSVLK